MANIDYEKELNVIGIEYEFLNISRDTEEFTQNVRRYLPRWDIVHDASCETPLQRMSDIPLIFSTPKRRSAFTDITSLPFTTHGGEVTSPIIAENDIYNNVMNLCSFFASQGELIDKRSSLHIHCNVGNSIPLYVLKNVLQMVLGMESFLYRIGGMGDINRGIYNHFVFQRPFSIYGAPVVRSNGGNYPIFRTDDLLTATSRAGFFNNYGDSIYCITNGNKYVTQRYTGTNFYSILRRESIEFRYANTVLKPDWILSYIDLLRSMMKRAFMTLDEFFLEDRPLNETMSVNDVFHLLDLFEISSTTKCNLYGLWEASGDLSDYQIVPVYSHLDNPSTYRQGFPYDPYTDDIKVIQAEKINIHTLSNEAKKIEDNSGIRLSRLIDEDNRLAQALFINNGFEMKKMQNPDWRNVKFDNNNPNPVLLHQDDEELNIEDDEEENEIEEDMGEDEEDCFDYLTDMEIRMIELKHRQNASIIRSFEEGDRMFFAENIIGTYKFTNNKTHYIAEIYVQRANTYIYEVVIEDDAIKSITDHFYKVVFRQPVLSLTSLLRNNTTVF